MACVLPLFIPHSPSSVIGKAARLDSGIAWISHHENMPI